MRRLLFVLALCLLPSLASAAIATDTSTDLGTGNSAGITAAFNNSAGTTLLVFIEGIGTAPNLDPYVSVTYNAVGMARIGVGGATTGATYATAIYCLASPATGSHNVIVVGTFNGNIAAHAVSFTGANGCTTDGTAVDQSQGCCGATITFNYTTSVANSWIFVAAYGQFAQPIIGTGLTTTFFATNSLLSATSGAVAATTTSLTVGNSANSYVVGAVAIQETSAGGGPACSLSLLGVGVC